MTRAVILVERGFQDEEFVYPYYRMLEEGWTVDVATPDGKDRLGKFGVPARASVAIPALQPPVDVLLLPGGFENPDRLRMLAPVRQIVREQFASGRLVAAICHAPSVLISAGVVAGKRLTGYESIRDDLVNAGAYYVDAPVVVFENLITAPHYRNNGDFMRAVVGWVNARR